MHISVIGCGHLGATHAACMASIGHEVVGVEIDEERTERLNSGRAWRNAGWEVSSLVTGRLARQASYA